MADRIQLGIRNSLRYKWVQAGCRTKSPMVTLSSSRANASSAARRTRASRSPSALMAGGRRARLTRPRPRMSGSRAIAQPPPGPDRPSTRPAVRSSPRTRRSTTGCAPMRSATRSEVTIADGSAAITASARHAKRNAPSEFLFVTMLVTDQPGARGRLVTSSSQASRRGRCSATCSGPDLWTQ